MLIKIQWERIEQNLLWQLRLIEKSEGNFATAVFVDVSEICSQGAQFYHLIGQLSTDCEVHRHYLVSRHQLKII
jgi:hypothetical protein